MEATATGLLSARFWIAELAGEPAAPPPTTTAIGALLGHITGGHLSADVPGSPRSYQPMNVNFGLFPPVDAPTGRRTGKAARKVLYTERARRDFADWHHRLRLPALT